MPWNESKIIYPIIPCFVTMYWLSYLVIAIILGGLYAAQKTHFSFTQIVLIQILLIFMAVNIPGLGDPRITNTVILDLAGRPIYVYHFSRFYTFLTMMYIHADFMHLIGNGLVLFFIGTALEDRIGKKKIILIYFTTGLIGTLSHYMVNWGGITLSLGASGAVFGIMGALFILYPKDKIPMFLGPIFMPAVRVDLSVAVFIAMQTGIAIIAPQGVAHAAHFGAFAAGMLIGRSVQRLDLDETRTVSDYSSLEVLVVDDETRRMYEKIEEADQEEVKEAWAEHLIANSDCPKCGRSLEKYKCECGFRLK